MGAHQWEIHYTEAGTDKLLVIGYGGNLEMDDAVRELIYYKLQDDPRWTISDSTGDMKPNDKMMRDYNTTITRLRKVED